MILLELVYPTKRPSIARSKCLLPAERFSTGVCTKNFYLKIEGVWPKRDTRKMTRSESVHLSPDEVDGFGYIPPCLLLLAKVRMEAHVTYIVPL